MSLSTSPSAGEGLLFWILFYLALWTEHPYHVCTSLKPVFGSDAKEGKKAFGVYLPEFSSLWKKSALKLNRYTKTAWQFKTTEGKKKKKPQRKSDFFPGQNNRYKPKY